MPEGGVCGGRGRADAAFAQLIGREIDKALKLPHELRYTRCTRVAGGATMKPMGDGAGPREGRGFRGAPAVIDDPADAGVDMSVTQEEWRGDSDRPETGSVLPLPGPRRSASAARELSAEPDEAPADDQAADGAAAPADFETALAAREEAELEDRCRRAADEGDPHAASLLGALLLRRGDPEEAEPYLRRAAGASLRAAVNNLGVLLHQRGLREEAAYWWRQAAVAGSAPAAYALGLYLRDHGDEPGSEYWLHHAA